MLYLYQNSKKYSHYSHGHAEFQGYLPSHYKYADIVGSLSMYFHFYARISLSKLFDNPGTILLPPPKVKRKEVA